MSKLPPYRFQNNTYFDVFSWLPRRILLYLDIIVFDLKHFFLLFNSVSEKTNKPHKEKRFFRVPIFFTQRVGHVSILRGAYIGSWKTEGATCTARFVYYRGLSCHFPKNIALCFSSV